MPQIVILGAGFGGLFAAKRLARVAADVTVVDRHNYHLFQPLLYQVAAAGLPPEWLRNIAAPAAEVGVEAAQGCVVHFEQREVGGGAAGP